VSYTECRTLLKLGNTQSRFSTVDCTVKIIFRTETQLVRQVEFAGGCSMLFCFDMITNQCRVFIDAELGEENGNLVLVSGGEIGPSAWN
jgi:hypothetical protein